MNKEQNALNRRAQEIGFSLKTNGSKFIIANNRGASCACGTLREMMYYIQALEYAGYSEKDAPAPGSRDWRELLRVEPGNGLID